MAKRRSESSIFERVDRGEIGANEASPSLSLIIPSLHPLEKNIIKRSPADYAWYQSFERGRVRNIESIESIGYTSQTYRIRFEDGEEIAFKPEESYAQYYDADPSEPKREDAGREFAHYLFDRMLGTNVDLPVLPAVIDKRRGSIRKFLPNVVTYFEIGEDFEKETLIPELQKMLLVDEVTNNTDRTFDNMLIDTDTHRLYGIDHGFTFFEDATQITSDVLEELHCLPSQTQKQTMVSLDAIPDMTDDIFQRMEEDLLEDIAAVAARHLTPRQVQASLERLRRIKEQRGIFLERYRLLIEEI